MTFLTSNTLSVLNLNGGLLGSSTSPITNSSIRNFSMDIGTIQTFSFSNSLSPPATFTGGVLTINAGTINWANQISVPSIQINGNCEIGFGVAPAVPINIEAAINVADSGTAFVNGNAADASTPTGAVFPTGTTIKVVSLTSATAICTITNNSGFDLNIKPSTTIIGGIAISKP
ncbi:MAG: hypothetical protein NTV80_18260 [Verrucomicrobia bacterium]|nr:hypothetical protein [Verrucomicrobiota bacterium]